MSGHIIIIITLRMKYSIAGSDGVTDCHPAMQTSKLKTQNDEWGGADTKLTTTTIPITQRRCPGLSAVVNKNFKYLN